MSKFTHKRTTPESQTSDNSALNSYNGHSPETAPVIKLVFIMYPHNKINRKKIHFYAY